jgi:Na+/H+-dicarboxylate symporter
MQEERQDTLSNDAIASATKAFEAALKDSDIPRSLAVRATILMEELLLRYQEQFGQDAGLSFYAIKRLGTVRLRIEVQGTQLNALDLTTTDDELGDSYDFIAALLEREIEPPSYGYRRGRNVIALNVRVRRQRPLWKNPMLGATLLAVIGFAVVSQTSASYANAIVDAVVSPVISLLMGVLKAIAGPLLCLSLISGICALGDMSTLKSVGKHAFLRIVCWVAVLIAASVAVSAIVFRGPADHTSAAFDAAELFELLLSSIPTNLFAPFVEGNMLQIAVESVFVGICLLALGERSGRIRELVIELNSLVFKMMYLFSGALPILIGFSVFETLVTTDLASLASIGMVVAINFAIMLLLAVASLLWIRITLHIPCLAFVRKLAPALVICLATGSGTSAMGEFYRISKEELGVDEAIADFWVPLGHAMYAPSTIVPLVVGMFAVAQMDGVTLGPTRIAILCLLVLQLSITTPKVPGGIAATYTILLGQLGLSLDAVGILMAANVLICNPSIAFGDLVRFVEVCSFSASERALNEDRLMSQGDRSLDS